MMQFATGRPAWRPLPPGVHACNGIPPDGGIARVGDGSLLLAQGTGVHDAAAKDAPVMWPDYEERAAALPATVVSGLIRLGSTVAPSEEINIHFFPLILLNKNLNIFHE